MLLLIVMLAVLLGGLGAGVAALLVRALTRPAEASKLKRRTKLAGGIAAGLAASLAVTVASSTLGDWLAVWLGIKSKSEVVLARALSPLSEVPIKSRRGKVYSHAYAAGLASRGVALLPAAELERWARMQLRLAEASPAYCAGPWRAGLSPDELYRALDLVTDAELRNFAELLARAGKLARDTPTSERPSGRALQQGMLAIAESLPATERAAFDAAIVLADPGPEWSCALFQLVLRRALGFAPAEREPFLRALATRLDQETHGAQTPPSSLP